MHTPVLLQAVIDALEVEDHGLYIDATAGEGGHTAAILDRGGYVLAIDWDDKQLDRLRVKMHNEHLRYGHGNYADIAHIARSQNFAPVNGVVFDFGLSMYQLSDGGRGFSYKKPSDPLDMRIDIQEDLHAEEILNTWDEADLEDIFSKCGEILGSDKLAHAIVRRRVHHRLKTVQDLLDVVEYINMHYALPQIFQALRIVVNHEFENIEKGLAGAVELLKPEGRIAVISFHSLEDRIVKNFVRDHKLKQITKKAIAGNQTKSFERPAKLRVFGAHV